MGTCWLAPKHASQVTSVSMIDPADCKLKGGPCVGLSSQSQPSRVHGNLKGKSFIFSNKCTLPCHDVLNTYIFTFLNVLFAG